MHDPAKSNPRSPRLVLGVLALGVVCIGGGLAAVYLERQAIGVRLVQDYLRGQGIPADVRLDHLDLGGASGSARLGPPGHPDLVIPHLAVRFDPWRPGSPFAPPQVRAVVLVQPTLRGEWRSGRLSFGSLQRLIDQSAHAKPSGRPGPDLRIRDGTLMLQTPAGLMRVAIDAVMRRGRLDELHARLTPLDLDTSQVRFASLGGELTARSVPLGRLRVTASFTAAQGHGQDFTTRDATLWLTALTPDVTAPSPAEALRPLDATLRLTADRLAYAPSKTPGVSAKTTDVTLRLDGGFDRTDTYTGRTMLAATADEFGSGRTLFKAVRLNLASSRLEARSGKAGVTGHGPFDLSLAISGGRAATPYGDATLTPGRLTASGRLSKTVGLRLEGHGAIAAGARLERAASSALARSLAGAPSPTTAALANALSSARFTAPAFSLALDDQGGGATLRLQREARLQLTTGDLTLRPAGGAALARADRHGDLTAALGLRARLGGLPQLDLDLAHGRLARDGAAEADFVLDARGDFGPVQDGTIRLHGALAGRGRSWILRAADCAEASARAIRGGDGAPLATGVKGQACPTGGAPLLALAPQGWRATARLQNAALSLPGANLQAGVEASDVTAGGRGHDLSGEVQLAKGTLQDTSPSPRFMPLTFSGKAGLAGGAAQGRFVVALADKPPPIGELTARADLGRGDGEVAIDTGRLPFDPKGLKPGDIAPMLARLLPEAQGGLRLQARAAWAGKALTSTSGELDADNFTFRSPAGRLSGVRGQVQLESLLTLRSAPGQTLTAERLDTLLPLTGLKAVFTLLPGQIALDSATAQAAGGQASLDPMRLPLGGSLAGTSGVLRLQGVDLEKVIGLFNLSDSVSLQARVSGELPFSLAATADGTLAPRLEHGRLYADGPGRLSIQRKALGAAVATADGAGAQPSAVQDFAYQALENLAFSKLEAEVASRPGGRLGAVLHVAGEHAPKTDRPTRIGLIELLRGHAFDKPLPLPKGTPIDLTLDTSLNLDDLLSAYGAINATPSSAKVQP